MEERGRLRGRRVLVVDDEPYILKILVFKLRTAGLVPLEAADGETALRVAAADAPDAVLLDVSLSPDLSGFEVLRRLKADLRTAAIPVVLLTGRTHPDERAKGLRLGAKLFLTKPFSTKTLLAELEGVLAAAGGRTEKDEGPPPRGEGPSESSVPG